MLFSVSPLIHSGGVKVILTLAAKSAPSLILTSLVIFAHWVCDVYLLAISVTGLDRSLHYHLLSAYSSAPRQLLWSWLDILLNGFWVFVNYVFTGVCRHIWKHSVCLQACPKAAPLFIKKNCIFFKGRGKKSFRVLNLFCGNLLPFQTILQIKNMWYEV